MAPRRVALHTYFCYGRSLVGQETGPLQVLMEILKAGCEDKVDRGGGISVNWRTFKDKVKNNKEGDLGKVCN
jgi:hypothetical protein